MTENEQRRAKASSQIADQKLADQKGADQEIDALLVCSAANVRYLSGYAGSNGLMLLSGEEAHFFTDPRYATVAAATITCKVHILKGPLILGVAALIKRKRFKKIGFEPAWLTMDRFEQLKTALPAGASLRPTGNIVEDLRAIKSADEIAKIRRSVQVNSEAFRRVLRRVRLRQSEQEIAAELDYQLRVLGAEKPAFDTIVAAGPASALPHAQPTAHRLEGNELLLIDMGAVLDGYTSDMTRVAYLGEPPKRVRDLYRAVLEAQLAGIDAVRPGVAASKVDGTARNVLKRHHLEREFVHSTGHGLGLEIHEAPKLGKKEKTRLRAGMVITIEPGAYIEGFGGVRIEDTVLVTENGCEVLTPTTKEFINL